MPAPVIPPALSCRDAEKPTQACAAQGNPTGALQPHSRPCHRRARRRGSRRRRRHRRQDVSGPGGRAAAMTGPPRPCAARGRPCVFSVSACGSISRSGFVVAISAPAAAVVHRTASRVGSCVHNESPDGPGRPPAVWSGQSLAHSVGSPATLKPRRAWIDLLTRAAVPAVTDGRPGWTTSPTRRSARASASEILASVRHCGRCTDHLGASAGRHHRESRFDGAGSRAPLATCPDGPLGVRRSRGSGQRDGARQG